MTRDYLLKVIDKNFWPLSKDEIAQQLSTVPLNLPDFLKEILRQEDESLSAPVNLKNFHPYFYEALRTVENRLEALGEQMHPNPLQLEKIFDEALLIISIYYRYPAVLFSNTMAEFIRFVLRTNVLLV